MSANTVIEKINAKAKNEVEKLLSERKENAKLLEEGIIKIAKEKNLAVAENFAFVYHPQIQKIKELIESNRIGNVQLIRSNFGFPFRSKNDFRYNKNLGGGALLDCGCYTLNK